MKFALLLTLMLMAGQVFGQTIREQKLKQEMLDRVDLMIDKIQLARKDLKKSDVIHACKIVEELFALYPDHVKAIGRHMDLFNSKVDNAKNDALAQLIFFHRQTLTCSRGKECEYVDPRRLSKELGRTMRSLKKQRKIISKRAVNFDNTFYYEYEF